MLNKVPKAHQEYYKKTIYILLIILFMPYKSFSSTCNIELYDRYIITNLENITSTDIVKSSSCSKNILSYFTSNLINLSGVINSRYILDTVDIKKNQINKITITPKYIEIYDLHELINKSINNKDNTTKYKAEKIKFNKIPKIIPLTKYQSYTLKCLNCSNTSSLHLSINLEINAGKKNSHWITAERYIRKKVFSAKQTIEPNTILNSNQFNSSYKYIKINGRYAEVGTNINYFKSTTRINIGAILKSNSLTRYNLVQAGRPAKIVIEHRGVGLSKIAIPIKSGKIGDFIELKAANNKKIIGQVTELNTVMVKL